MTSDSRSSAPNKNSSESVRPENSTTNENQNVPTNPSLSTNTAPTPPNFDNADGGKHGTPFWEKLAVLIALGLLIVNIFQMRATQKSANAAKSSAEMEKRTAEKRDEAICRVEGDIAVGSDVFQTYINNSGNVTARKLSGHVEISLNKLPSNKKIRLLTSFDIAPQDVPSQKGLQHFDNTGISHAEWENIINTHDSLVETSTIQYDNGFDRLVTVPRCYVMVWIPSPNDPQNRAHGSGLDCERLAQWSETNIAPAKQLPHHSDR